MFERDLSLYSLTHSSSMQTFTKSHNFSSGLCLILGTFLSIHYTNTINIITRIRLSGPMIKRLWLKKTLNLYLTIGNMTMTLPWISSSFFVEKSFLVWFVCFISVLQWHYRLQWQHLSWSILSIFFFENWNRLTDMTLNHFLSTTTTRNFLSDF